MVVIPIEGKGDVVDARRKGRQLANEIGFESREAGLIGIAISELATNVIKHGTEGTVKIERIEGGVQIVCNDQGPGMEDPRQVLENTKGHMLPGSGLSSVQRIGDEIGISSEVGKGTKITVKKWKDPPFTKQKRKNKMDINGVLRYGVVSIPALGEELNGDQFFIKEQENRSIFIGLIDGLGHGKRAWEPATKARNYLETHLTESPSRLIRGCHRTLRSSRGVVMGLSTIDLEQSTITYSGIGNIGMKILRRNDEIVRPISLPGIVGRRFRKVKEWELPYNSTDTLYFFSDGVFSKFDPEKWGEGNHTPEEIAENIMREFGNPADDSTIIVARE